MHIKKYNSFNPSEYLNVTQDTDTNIDEFCATNKLFDQETFDQNTSEIIEDAIIQFILKIYNNSALPRNIVQIITEDLKHLFKTIIAYIKSKLNGSNSVEDIFKNLYVLLSKINDTFEMLGTEHKRLKFLEDKKCYVKPQAFFIGETSILQKKRSHEANMIIRKSEGQIIQLRHILKHFLELPNVFHDIVSYMQREESLYDGNVRTSILQGDLWRKTRLKFENKIVFPLYLFYDDFEPNNPLGSKSNLYKIGAIYISVASVPVQYASLLENIFLAQLNFSTDRAQYGNKNTFHKIIQELKYLETEGIEIQTSEKNVRVYFTLLLILGDNLGLNSILGFSESFISYYFCRFCKIHKNESKYQVIENEEYLRNIDNYNSDSLSLSYGVKEICIWHELSNFHVTNNLSCDLMHDMLEGVLRYDMAQIISHLIKKKYFSLEQLNERIKYFKFSEADTGNPIPLIISEHLKKRYIMMSASEMLALSIYFCILVGDLVPSSEPVCGIFTFFYIIC